MVDPLIDSLRRAVAAAPDDGALRLHLADLELADGQCAAAIATISVESFSIHALTLDGEGDRPSANSSPTAATYGQRTVTRTWQ